MKNKTRLLILCVLLVVITVSVVMVIITNRNAEKNKHPDYLTGPVKATMSVKINTSVWKVVKPLLKSIPLVSSYASLFDAGIEAANNLTIEGTWDGSDVKLGLVLKEKDLVSAALRKNGDQLIVRSEVLPENAVAVVTADELVQLTGLSQLPDLNLEFTPEDLRTMENAVKSAAAQFSSRLDDETGPEEKGSWDFEGHTFSSRRRINASARQLSLFAMEAVQSELSGEELTGFLTRIGLSPESMNLSYRIDSLKSDSDEHYPAVRAYRYKDGDSVYTEFTFNLNEEELSLRFGTIDLTTYIRYVVAATNEGFVLVADSRGYNYDFTAASSLKSLGLGNIFGTGGSSYGYSYNSGYDTAYTESSSGTEGAASSGNPGYGASGFGFGPDDVSVMKLTASGKTSQSGERDGKIIVRYAGLDLITVNYTIKKGSSLSSLFDLNGRRVMKYDELTSREFSDWLQDTCLPGFIIRLVDAMPEVAAAVLEAVTGIFKYMSGF